MKEQLKSAFRAVDLRDVGVIVGLVLVYVGGSRLSQPWTLVALGVVLVAAALLWRRS